MPSAATHPVSILDIIGVAVVKFIQKVPVLMQISLVHMTILIKTVNVIGLNGVLAALVVVMTVPEPG